MMQCEHNCCAAFGIFTIHGAYSAATAAFPQLLLQAVGW
jgi:hypothetical protein